MSSTRCGAGRMEMLRALLNAAAPTASIRQQGGRTRLVESVERMWSRSWTKPAVFALVLAAATVPAALGAMRLREHAGALTPVAWRVEDGTTSARGYVSVPWTAPPARLVFGDGDDVALAPGSRGRVAETTPVGARLVLEHGRAHVRAPHGDAARWTVDAGPFAVRSNGGAFLVAWSAEAETLDVWAPSGRVEVTGSPIDDALSLSAGQHVLARLRDGTLRIDAEQLPSDPLLSLPPSRAPGSEPCAVR